MLNKTAVNGAVKRLPSAMVGTAPRVEIVTITPEIAQEWLTRNSGNQRPISKSTVNMYARDMREGRWQTTHQGVAFNRTGEVIDGQHRLAAIVEANVPVQMAVATGFDAEFDAPIDQGRARSAAAILHKSSKFVSVTRALFQMKNGTVANSSRASVSEIRDAAESFAGDLELISNEVLGLPAGIVAAIVWALPLNRDLVLNFAQQVTTGEMLERGDPAFSLRGWRERNRRAQTAEFIFATSNCLRAAFDGVTLGSVYTGHTGFRWLCQRRRAERLPNSPTPQQVPAPGDGEWFPGASIQGRGKIA